MDSQKSPPSLPSRAPESPPDATTPPDATMAAVVAHQPFPPTSNDPRAASAASWVHCYSRDHLEERTSPVAQTRPTDYKSKL